MDRLTARLLDDALAKFTEYFVANYPGPHTIIHDPKWHAPKIFRAAQLALGAVDRQSLSQEAVRDEAVPSQEQLLAGLTAFDPTGHPAKVVAAIYQAMVALKREPNAAAETGQCWIPEPVAWRREWDGDISDVGHMIYVDDPHDRDEPLSRWQPLYAREPGASDE